MKLLTSKRFQSVVGYAILAIINAALEETVGYSLDEATMQKLLTIVGVYVGGQSLSDSFGKGKVEATNGK